MVALLRQQVCWLTGKRLLIIGLGVLLGQFLFIMFLASGSSGFTAGQDFWQHYLAAQAIRSGRLEEVRAWPGNLSYPYPFFVPLFLLPLSFLPPPLALGIWIFTLYLALGGATYFLARRLVGLDPPFALLLTVGALIWPPSLFSFFQAQISPWLLVFLAIAWWLYQKEQRLAAGAVLALGLMKPHLLAGVIAGIGLRKEWRVLAGFLLGAILLLGLSVAAGQGRSPADLGDYLFSWFLNNPRSVSLVGRLWFLPWPIQVGLSLGLWGGIAWWWLRKREVTPWAANLGYVAFLAAGPYLLIHDLVLVIPALILLASHPNGFFWATILLSATGLLGLGFADPVALSLLALVLALWRGSQESLPQNSGG